jgi:DNA-binding SARP family transcriptional activator
MEFRILGSFEVVGSAGALELRGAKRRGLLACLVAHAGQPMTTDRLVEELWADGGSAGAPRTVQTYVSQLRKLLHGGSARLVSRPGGYVLDLDPADIDACRFERAVTLAGSEPDPGARLALLDEALDLWRGPPLAEFAGAGWADHAAARLDGLHRLAVQRRYDTLLDLDRAGEAVAGLELLVRAHPLDERVWAQLMLALYRSGRQADALGAYQQARRHLVEGLGIEPGLELARLEHRILDHDPTLASTHGRAAVDPRRVSARDGTDAWAPPTGTVAFLLIDQEQSSLLGVDLPEAMDLAVARYDALLRSIVARSAHVFVVTSPTGPLIEPAAQRHEHARSRATVPNSPADRPRQAVITG